MGSPIVPLLTEFHIRRRKLKIKTTRNHQFTHAAFMVYLAEVKHGRRLKPENNI